MADMSPEMQTLVEMLAELNIVQHIYSYGLMECMVNGQKSIALVRRKFLRSDDDCSDLEPIMVTVNRNTEAKPLADGMFVFIGPNERLN